MKKEKKAAVEVGEVVKFDEADESQADRFDVMTFSQKPQTYKET